MQGAEFELALDFFQKRDLVLNFSKAGLAIWEHIAP
jgi:hypothetical protein